MIRTYNAQELQGRFSLNAWGRFCYRAGAVRIKGWNDDAKIRAVHPLGLLLFAFEAPIRLLIFGIGGRPFKNFCLW